MPPMLEQMGLLSALPEHPFPRNVALMLFCETPEKFFPYTYIELIHFRGNPGDRDFNETRFAGPVQYQIRQLLDYLKGNILTEKVIKHPDRAEATRLFNYPLAALEGAIANCIYLRDYTVREPVKVFIEADHIRLQNSGGPDRAIRSEDFLTGCVRPKRYRNRRLGDFMKGLDLTEGHATGIRLILDTMAFNGSSAPIFNFDEERSFFEVELPIHPEFLKSSVADSLENVSGPVPLTAAEQTEFASLLPTLTKPGMDMIGKLSGKVSYSRKELLMSVGLANHSDTVKRHIDPLLTMGILLLTDHDSPRSPRQSYTLTERGRRLAQYHSEQRLTNHD